MQLKLYLAGPEVFLPNVVENAEIQRKLCFQYGFISLHPTDNNFDLVNQNIETARVIYRGDIGQIHECDVVVANCNGFRGICIDDGTSYELGYGNALKKPSYGYIRKLDTLVERTIRDYPCRPFKDGIYIDQDGYLVVDDFGTSINLMIQCGMMFRNGKLVEGGFETCLKVLRADVDTGKLKV